MFCSLAKWYHYIFWEGDWYTVFCYATLVAVMLAHCWGQSVCGSVFHIHVIRHNISVLNDITCVAAQKQFNGNESQNIFLVRGFLLNIHGYTILPKSRSHLKILAWEGVTYWGSTNIRCFRTKFCWCGSLVSGICAPLFMILKTVTNMTVDFREKRWNLIWVSCEEEFTCDTYKSKFKFT